MLFLSVWVFEEIEGLFLKGSSTNSELLNSWVDSPWNAQFWISASRTADLNSFDAESSLGTTVIIIIKKKKRSSIMIQYGNSQQKNKSQQSLLFNIFLGKSNTLHQMCEYSLFFWLLATLYFKHYIMATWLLKMERMWKWNGIPASVWKRRQRNLGSIREDLLQTRS